MPLSLLYQWQEILNVPVSELLENPDGGLGLSHPVKMRARLLRAAKTVVTILERSKQSSIRDLARGLIDQLAMIMPELKGVSSWPIVGKRRRSAELGAAAHRALPADFFRGVDGRTG
jgi:hypothetical protein